MEKPVLGSLFNKVADIAIVLYLKETPSAQMISSEVWEIFKNILFREHLRTTASDFGFILFAYFCNWIREN